MQLVVVDRQIEPAFLVNINRRVNAANRARIPFVFVLSVNMRTGLTARDIIFTEQKLMGISPIYKGTMGIDATWKEGYPKPLVMTDSIRKRVEERWDSYWR